MSKAAPANKMSRKSSEIIEAALLVKNSAGPEDRKKAQTRLFDLVGNCLNDMDESSVMDANLSAASEACRSEIDQAIQEKVENVSIAIGKKTILSSIFAIPVTLESSESVGDSDTFMHNIINDDVGRLESIIKESTLFDGGDGANGDYSVSIFGRLLSREDLLTMGSCWLRELNHIGGSAEHKECLLEDAGEILPFFCEVDSSGPKTLFMIICVSSHGDRRPSINKSKVDDDNLLLKCQDKIRLVLGRSAAETLKISISRPSSVILALNNERSISEEAVINTMLNWSCASIGAVPAETYFQFSEFTNQAGHKEVLVGVFWQGDMIGGRLFENSSALLTNIIVNIAKSQRMMVSGFSINGEMPLCKSCKSPLMFTRTGYWHMGMDGCEFSTEKIIGPIKGVIH